MSTWYSKAQSDTLLAGKDAAGAAAAAQTFAVQRGNHTGTQSADTVVDGATNKAYTAGEKTKLAGIATGATANRADSAVDTLLAAKADLVGGVIPTGQIPAIAIVQYLGTSANQTAMLALSGQQGDWTIRTDLGTTWQITGSDPTQLSNWTALAYPTAPVQSVAGKTGIVTLAKTDVGLGNVDNTADSAKPVSTAQATAIAAKLAAASNLSDLASASTARTNLGLGSSSTHPATDFAAPAQVPGTVVLGLAAGTAAASANAALIQAAINAAGTAGGGEVIIPVGAWYTNPLTMQTGVTLRGLGWGSILRLANSANANMITLASTSTVWTGLRDIMLDGNKANQTAGSVVYLDNTGLGSGASTILDDDPNHQFSHVAVLNGYADGLHVTGPRGQSQIHSVFAYENNGRGIYIDSPDNQLAHCVAAANGLQGFYISGSAHQTRGLDLKAFFNGGLDPSSNGEGFTVLTAQRVELTHVEAQDNNGQGFVLVNAKNLRLSGIAERNGLGGGPTYPGGTGDGMYVSGLVDSVINLTSADRNQSSVLMQRWAYNVGGTNTGNVITIVCSAMQSGTIGNGDWGPSNVVTATYAGAVVAVGATAVLTNAQTGTSYTLASTDVGKVVEMSNAAANTLTIPPNSAVAYPIGTVIEVFQAGAGQTTVTPGAGVTLRAPSGAKILAQYGSASLRKRGTDEWVLAGNTTA